MGKELLREVELRVNRCLYRNLVPRPKVRNWLAKAVTFNTQVEKDKFLGDLQTLADAYGTKGIRATLIELLDRMIKYHGSSLNN